MDRFDTSRLYLYRVLPWHPIGDPAAFVNIMWTHQGAGYSKPAWRGTPCQSIEECITTVQRAMRSPLTRDIYVCMSTQREVEIKQTAGGKEFKVAKRSQQNAVQLRSLFADIDVKEGAYPTTKDAMVAFKDFLGAAGIPRPTILVASGTGGFHTYWTTDRAMSVGEWQPLANALAEALRRFGIKADTACTIDAARVLRVPGTYNSKTNPPASVEMALNAMLPHDYTVDQLRHALAPYMGAQVIPLNPRGKNERGASNLSAGIDAPQTPPINLQSVSDAGCGFVGDALRTGGANYNNPLWNLSTLISVFTEGGREDAHRMARGHADYSVEDTDALFDRKVVEKDIKNLGWPACQTIENSGCAACGTCPLKGPGTRPLQFGRPTPAPADDLGPLPHGYSRNPQGYVMRAKKGKEDGTTIQVSATPFPVQSAWVQEDPWTLHFHMRTRPDQDFKQVSVTTRQANSLERFVGTMGEYGIPLDTEQAKEFRSFIVAWQTTLQKTKDGVVSAAAYGWSSSSGKIDGFAFGGKIWSPSGERPASTADLEIARQYRPQGDIEVWKRAARMVTDLESPSRNAMLASAFAGPLVQFTGLEGLLVSAYSIGSGFGKTSIMKIAQGVWARPAIGLNGLTDTNKSTFGKAATLKNIPLFWDELKSEQDKMRFVDIAFQLSAGTDTARMSADTSLRRRGEWKTLVMSACNDSILELIGRQVRSTTAGVHRVYEWTVDKVPPIISGTLADQYVLGVQNNYGQAGLQYAKWLGENHAAVHAEVTDVREKLEKALGARSEERFWLCSVVCLWLGAKYANKAGLTEIDLKELLTFLMAQFHELRKHVAGTDADLSVKRSTTGVLGQFLSEMRARHTLKTDKLWTARGRPNVGDVKVLSDTGRMEALYVHIAMETARVRFSQKAFNAWLEKEGYSITAVTNFLRQNANMTSVYARLGAGTDLATLQMHLHEVDLKDMDT